MSTDPWPSFGVERHEPSTNETPAAASCGPGLDPYSEPMAAGLFERDEELTTAVQALEHGRHLLVVGDRWAGKTSFVDAGLLPRLRRRDHLHRKVHAFSLLPSGDAIESILHRLEQLRLMASTEESDASSDTHATVRSRPANAIVVDALEALLDHPDPARCEQLIEALGARVFTRSGSIVVLAVRSERVEPLVRRYPALGPLLAALVRMHVEPLRAQRLRRFIESYAAHHSVSIGGSLVLRILQDARPFSVRCGVAGSDAAPVMPMISLLMSALIARVGRGGRAEPQHYHEIGGITGPITRLTTAATQLTMSELACLRQMITSMASSYFDGSPCVCPVYTRPGRATNPAGPDPGCSVPAILARAGIGAEVEVVASDLGASYFLRHDAVLRFWPLAREWLAAEQRRTSEPLRTLMSLYVRTGRCSFRAVDRSVLASEPIGSGERALVKKLRRDRWWWRVRSMVAFSSVATLGLALHLLASRGVDDGAPARCEWEDHSSESVSVLAEGLQVARDRLGEDEVDARHRIRLVRAELALDVLRNGGQRTTHTETLEHRLHAEQALLRSGCDAALPHLRAEVTTTRKAIEAGSGATARPLFLAYQRVAECHSRQGRPREAVVALTELLDAVTTAVDQGMLSLDDESRRELAETFHARSRIVEGSEALTDRVSALEHYDSMARRPNTATIEAKMTLHLELGDLYLATRERSSARRSYEALLALDEQRDPAERSPTHARTRQVAHGRLSEIAALAGDFSRAREHLELELDATWTSLLAAPSDAGRRDVASVFLRLGRLELELGRRDAARTRLLQGLSAVLEMKDLYEVFDDEPMKALLTEDLATYLGVLGELEQQDGNLGAARAHYERAQRLLQQRVSEDPEGVGARLALAGSLERLADLWMALDEPERAVGSLELEVDLIDGVLEEQRDHGAARADLVHRLARVHIDALHACLVGGNIEAGGAHLEVARVLVASLEPKERELLAERYIGLVDYIHEMEEVMALPIEGLRGSDP